MMLHKLLMKVGSHTPVTPTTHDIYIINGAYYRLGSNKLKEYNYPYPEDIKPYETQIVYRITYPGKVHYWNSSKNSPGHVREDSDMRDLTQEQEACLVRILEDYLQARESEE